MNERDPAIKPSAGSRRRLRDARRLATRAEWLLQQANMTVVAAYATGDLALARDALQLRALAAARFSGLIGVCDTLAARIINEES